MKQALCAAALAVILGPATVPAISATVQPLHSVEANKAGRMDWQNIPGLAFTCEDGAQLASAGMGPPAEPPRATGTP